MRNSVVFLACLFCLVVSLRAQHENSPSSPGQTNQQPTSEAEEISRVPHQILDPSAVCDPRTFGAKGDGKTPDTQAIESAIDACASKGGGTVHMTAGTYLSAPLTIKSHVHLQLDKGAVLLGSLKLEDYPVRPGPESNWRRVALLHGDNLTDIAFTGEGVIDGSGKPWWDIARANRRKANTSGNARGQTRPMLFDLVQSKQVVFDGITIRNSPMYTIALFQCEGVQITNITIKNPPNSPNTDGIDPFSSAHIKIDHVTIDTGDDDIAIKSGLVERGEPNIPTYDVVVTNSTLLHGHGLSIGSEVAGGVHDVTVDDVTFHQTDNGIRVKSNRTRGNDVYNLKYSNIKMTDVGTPILITEYYPHIPDSDKKQPMAEHTPRFKNIFITNVTATGAARAMQIAGLPESPVQDLILDNVTISAEKGAKISNANLTMKNVVVKVAAPPDFLYGDNATVKQAR